MGLTFKRSGERTKCRGIRGAQLVAALCLLAMLETEAEAGGVATMTQALPAETASALDLNEEAVRLEQLGRYPEAEALLVRARALIEQQAGPDAALTVTITGNLALLYRLQGRFADADPLFLRALAASERRVGRDHPETLALAANLADSYFRQRRFAEAEPLLVGTLAARERVLGPAHVDTLASVVSLANAYSRQGRTNLAEPLFVRGLAGQEQALGRDHAVTIGTLQDLSRMYASHGRHAEAEPLLVRALAGVERALGPDHRTTLDTVTRLGVSRFALGHYAEAEPLAVRALRTSERLLGPDHADTLMAASNLGQLYAAQNRQAEAETLLRRVHETAGRVFGREHPDTLIAGMILAQQLRRQLKLAEAEALMVSILATQERVLGRDHGDTLISLNRLEQLYAALGRYAEAEPLALRVLEATERLFGPDDPNTLISLNSLAIIYMAQDRFAEAEPLLLRRRETSERLRGRDHGESLDAIEAVATLYMAQDRLAEAEPLLVAVVEARERLHGRDDEATLASASSLGTLYLVLGRYSEAEPRFVRALEQSERLLGREHPDTAAEAARLGGLYAEQHRYAQAEPLLTRALHTSEQTLGLGHPRTQSQAQSLVFTLLHQPDRAAFALEPARRLLAGGRFRSRSAGTGLYAARQRGRESASRSWRAGMFADAAWMAAQAHPGQSGALRTEAFAALQHGLGRTTSDAIARTAVRRVAERAGAGLGALVRERDVLNDRWAVNNDGAFAAFSGTDETARAEQQSQRAEREGIEARMEAIDSRLRTEFPDYFGLVEPQALSVAEAQGLLQADEAILIVIPTGFGTQVMAVTRDRLEWIRSSWTYYDLRTAVTRLRLDVGAAGEVPEALAQEWRARNPPGAPPRFDRATAFAMYRQLIEPVAGVLAGKRRLYIAASGPLSSLPFSILVTRQPSGEDNDPEALRDTAWFAEAHALVHIPSLQSLALLRRARAREDTPGDGGFVGFGDPVLLGAPPSARPGPDNPAPRADAAPSAQARGARGPRANVSSLRRLARLEATARELENLRLAFQSPQSSVYVGDRATESAVRTADLSRVRVLAFATHGLAGGELSSVVEPGLVLTPPQVASDEDDGYLAASEVAALHLNTEWVILSACNTATGDESQGLSTLVRAFFYAGARTILASHWPVDDEVASLITVRTVQLERTGMARAEAFQQAMREIRRDDTRRRWAHPIYWAPFVLIGDGGR